MMMIQRELGMKRWNGSGKALVGVDRKTVMTRGGRSQGRSWCVAWRRAEVLVPSWQIRPHGGMVVMVVKRGKGCDGGVLRGHGSVVGSGKRGGVKAKAGNDSSPFDFNMYHEAEISEVKTADGQGNVIYLKLKDGHNSILPVYIGEFECGALIKEMHKRNLPRPGTHDLMKNMMDSLGYKVTKVRISSLVGNIYHARIHLTTGTNGDASDGGHEIDIDARPSDAINMAARFNAPIYVNKEVAAKMAHPMHAPESSMPTHAASQPGAQEIIRSCKEEILHYSDPTIMHKVQLQVAIAEERFKDASKLRDEIDKLLASDRALSLVVAIETALEDERYEEAARLRDEFRKLRLSKKSSSPSS